MEHETRPAGAAGELPGMIEESLHVLDKRRVEIKQWLTCRRARGSLSYEVETWFFLPTSLQINRWNYDPQSCRQRLKNYIRQNAPLVSMASLNAGHSLLREAAALLRELKDGASPPRAARLEETFRLFALLYQRALSHERRRIEAGLEQSGAARASEGSLELFRNAARALAAYRNLRLLVESLPEEASMPAFAYCDEFLGIVTTHHMSTLLGEVPPSEASIRHRLEAVLHAQMRYRLARYPESVPEEEGDNEIAIYRWSVLKKFVSAPLFLEVRPKSGNHPLVDTVYIVSAAFAVIFATAMTFFVQRDHAAFSPTLFAMVVVGYIFRERFKDMFRRHLFKLTQRWVPDRRQAVYAERDTTVGRCDESFRFVPGERHLPEEARLMRDKKHIVEVDNSFRSEDILYYSKMVDINRLPNPFDVGMPQVMDIWRFDISDFLLHTTEAPEELPAMDDERIPLGEKVYHVNMIRKITQDGCVAWERYRLILTSEGIKRVDEVFALAPEAAGE